MTTATISSREQELEIALDNIASGIDDVSGRWKRGDEINAAYSLGIVAQYIYETIERRPKEEETNANV